MKHNNRIVSKLFCHPHISGLVVNPLGLKDLVSNPGLVAPQVISRRGTGRLFSCNCQAKLLNQNITCNLEINFLGNKGLSLRKQTKLRSQMPQLQGSEVAHSGLPYLSLICLSFLVKKLINCRCLASSFDCTYVKRITNGPFYDSSVLPPRR